MIQSQSLVVYTAVREVLWPPSSLACSLRQWQVHTRRARLISMFVAKRYDLSHGRRSSLTSPNLQASVLHFLASAYKKSLSRGLCPHIWLRKPFSTPYPRPAKCWALQSATSQVSIGLSLLRSTRTSSGSWAFVTAHQCLQSGPDHLNCGLSRSLTLSIRSWWGL